MVIKNVVLIFDQRIFYAFIGLCQTDARLRYE